MRAGHVLRGRGASKKPATAGRAMPMVVVEQEAQEKIRRGGSGTNNQSKQKEQARDGERKVREFTVAERFAGMKTQNRRSGRGSQALQEVRERRRTRRRTTELSTADLVLLSLLTERPMHGYQANAELVRREVQDWAGISRPQVYYSMEKLTRLGLLRMAADRAPAEGPERQVYTATAKGQTALASALAREEWTMGRDRPAFLTWMALSWQAGPGVFEKQLQRRREFVKHELERERETLESVLQEVGHAYHEAVWMVTLMIEKFEAELNWLHKVGVEMSDRAPAQNPEHASETDHENGEIRAHEISRRRSTGKRRTLPSAS
jgi:DNA-binding PadR family transcriptional regulator